MRHDEIIEARTLSSDDKLLIDAFTKMEIDQVDLLDTTAKRIIELVSAFLSLFFLVAAFGDKFPPTYLVGSGVKLLSVVSLAVFICSMLFAVLSLQPRNYKRFKSNVSEMKNEFDRIVGYKAFTVRCAAILFFLGSASFAGLTAYLIVSS